MKVLVYSVHSFDREILESYSGTHEVTFTDEHLTKKTVGLAKGYKAVAVFSSSKIDEELIGELAQNGVMYLTTRSVGVDHIDLVAADAHGISVANVPAYSPYSVSEHAVALLLALVRKIVLAQKLFTAQDFRLDQLVGFDLYGKKVGIIGYGKIGSNFGKIMKGFGCEVMAYDCKPNDAEASAVEYVSFTKVLRESDVLYLSCPLDISTHHLIGRDELREMKRDAIIINTARGAVIDTAALVELMEQGHLGGAGLDVYEFEKGLYFNDYSNKDISAPYFHRLSQLGNVIMTAHQGFLTREALQGIAETTFHNVDQWERLGRCDNDINPQIYADIEKRITMMGS